MSPLTLTRARLRAVMPAESTIDIDTHADRIADTVTLARRTRPAQRALGRVTVSDARLLADALLEMISDRSSVA